MALKSIDLAPGTTITQGEDFIRGSKRTYRAFFDAGESEVYVLQHCGFTPNTPHPDDLRQVVVGIEAQMVEPQTTWHVDNSAASLWAVVVTYGPWNPMEHSYDGNPLHMPPRVSTKFTLAEVAAFQDVDGNPIVNTAGDPYDPPLTREVLRATITVRRNEAYFATPDVSAPTSDLGKLAAFSNTTNHAAWPPGAPTPFPARTVRLFPVEIPEPSYSQVSHQFYYEMVYTFEVNWDTWDKQILNVGFRELDDDGNLVTIYIDGAPASTPVPLDLDGKKILAPTYRASGDDPPEDDVTEDGGGQPPSGGTGLADTSNLVVNVHRMLRVADFSFLGMDDIFTLPVLS